MSFLIRFHTKKIVIEIFDTGAGIFIFLEALQSFHPGYSALIKEQEILYLKHACFGLWLKEQGILHLKCATK